ncbi:LysR family transcriptional regulator [Amycolatopsis endophytica]|uniref:DNA-binding transcriptional LysR family regulator n=1 Tax=Amycolatopsis endophytica TaxID=860233 RepID=A0A853B3C0_9PSEU|nr:LysR family transcriptional regulator [Amycolatopsis endophytica]NYI89304.1 DNA-binding transcriptional LysR family regulator [Amycolatopsis endophytica]
MEVFHLRYFVVVAEELNFSQAARKLHMAASPLSQRIKDLERELGHQLFRRSTHTVELTEAGAALLPLARETLEHFNSIPWRLREALGPRHRMALIGVPAGLHPDLRARVQQLEERCRDRFDLKRWPGRTTDLIEAVHDGQLSLALVRLPVSDPALEVAQVLSERLGAVLPADRFARRDEVSLSDLSDLPYVPVPAEAQPVFFEQLDQELRVAGIKKRLKPPRTDYSGVAEIVASGLGFTLSMLDPQSPMRNYSVENVAVLPITDFAPELRTGLIWRRDRAGDGAELAGLISDAREIFAQMV